LLLPLPPLLSDVVLASLLKQVFLQLQGSLLLLASVVADIFAYAGIPAASIILAAASISAVGSISAIACVLLIVGHH
jgi:hypothetical protein